MWIGKYLISRVLIALITLLGASLVVFIAMRAVPGGYEDMILGPFGTEAKREVIREAYGLNEPPVEQYAHWLSTVAKGDFGTSLSTRRPVSDEILRRAPATIQLALMATMMALVVGIPAGIASGLSNTSRLAQTIGRVVGGLGASTPEFVLGTALVFLFSDWHWGPTIGNYVPFFEAPIQNLKAMILPSLTLSVFGMALIQRTTRDAVIGVTSQTFVLYAISRGEAPMNIVKRHVIRNASIPIITVTTIYLAYLLGGAIIVEQIFSIPGIGTYLISSVNNRDYQVVQAGVLLSVLVFVSINMLADVVYVMIDPRIGSKRKRSDA